MSARREPIGLSRARVCKEALALVDKEGLEALSMRRLAARLDCEAMSLYKHVRDKADLLDALHAAVLGDLQPEAALDRRKHSHDQLPPWRLLLGGLARALRTALLRHPNVVPLFTTRPLQAPEALATVERATNALIDAHFPGTHIDRALYVVGMFTIGHAIFKESERMDDTFNFGLEALLDGIESDHRASKRQK